MRSRNYYIVRGAVRFVFWTAVFLAGGLALQLFIVALWAIQGG